MMTCTCGHEYDEHDAGGPCEAVVYVDGVDDRKCPCVHYEGEDADG